MSLWRIFDRWWGRCVGSKCVWCWKYCFSEIGSYGRATLLFLSFSPLANNQRRPRLVDANTISLVDDQKSTLVPFRQDDAFLSVTEVISEVIEAKLGIRHVNYVVVVLNFSFVYQFNDFIKKRTTIVRNNVTLKTYPPAYKLQFKLSPSFIPLCINPTLIPKNL